MVVIEILNVGQGDKEIYLTDVTPEERDQLALEVKKLMKQGFALFLIQGEESRQITGYDKKSHQWIILSDAKPAPKKKAVKEQVSAQGTRVTGVGATAGG